jgi:hypothetical protein
VTGTKPLPLQADIFSHAKELLVELAGVRSALGAGARPIVFVAHSTGGVLVKDVSTPHVSGTPLSDSCSCCASPRPNTTGP